MSRNVPRRVTSPLRGGALLLAALLLVPVLAPATALGAESETFIRGGVALGGTDPVAYFSEGRARAGDAKFHHSWKNARWHFSSAANRDAFAADPERYAPRFGGYCAWAVSRGYTASTDPEAWSIVDGRLYLNYSLGVRDQWEQDIPGNITAGEKNWPGVLKR